MNLIYDLLLLHLLASTFNCCLGRHGGTPLHHAAKRGFDSIVKLLLLHGGMVKCL